MTYSLHRGAEADLLDAAGFYRREGGARLANRFLDAFERAAELLVRFPEIGTPAGDLRRSFPLHDFPYSLIYRDFGGHIRILVLRAHQRDPGHGESRR